MEQHGVTVTLSAAEWRLISSLRDIPDSALKAALDEVLLTAVELVREPKCSQVQADGVPCGRAAADSESCVRITGVLGAVKKQLSSV